MEKKIALGMLLFSILVLIVAILLPGGRTVEGEPLLPWKIELKSDGATQVFGLTLGRSTVEEARQRFHQDGAISLFRNPQGKMSLEVYFDRVFLSGLRGDYVLRVAVAEAELQNLYDRGVRISQLGNGSNKVELSSRDQEWVYQQPIEVITYIPMTRLDEALIEERFGPPAEKITEEKSGVVHWLYPEQGLDLGRDPRGRSVLQYIHPAEFARLTAPFTP